MSKYPPQQTAGKAVPRAARGNAGGPASGLRGVRVSGGEVGGPEIAEPEEGASTRKKTRITM